MNFKRKTSHADPYLFFHGINLIATRKFAILESRKEYQNKYQINWEWWVCLYKVWERYRNQITVIFQSHFWQITWNGTDKVTNAIRWLESTPTAHRWHTSQTHAKPACIFPRKVTGTTVSQSVIYSTYQGVDQKDVHWCSSCDCMQAWHRLLFNAVSGSGGFWGKFRGILNFGKRLSFTGANENDCFGNSTMQSMQQTLYITHEMTAWDSSIIPSL